MLKSTHCVSDTISYLLHCTLDLLRIHPSSVHLLSGKLRASLVIDLVNRQQLTQVVYPRDLWVSFALLFKPFRADIKLFMQINNHRCTSRITTRSDITISTFLSVSLMERILNLSMMCIPSIRYKEPSSRMLTGEPSLYSPYAYSADANYAPD